MYNLCLKNLIVGAALLSAGPCLAQSLAQTYNFTKVQVPHAFTTNARGINNAGEVVGYYLNSNASVHGFIESGGTYRTVDEPGARTTQLIAVNGSIILGQTTGALSTSGFMLDGAGHFTAITPPGAASTFPIGLNANGATIVGYINSAASAVEEEGFVLSKGKYRLVTLPNAFDTEINGVNDSGVFAGSYRLFNASVFKGFIYNHGVFKTVLFPGAYQTFIQDINNAGVVVGYYATSPNSGFTGFTYDGTTFTSYKPPAAGSTYGFGINDAGAVTGFGFDASRNENGYVGTPSPASSALARLGTPIQ